MRRDEPLKIQRETGEVRVPITLYDLDEARGDIDLVLSRAEAQRLFTGLADALGLALQEVPGQRGLEAVR
ncbi:hypothetical protein ACH4JS_26345 [Streptomyces sp. NPDC017638]|uniref:hypothetical protein n=1 Tax=Streptomyces sp. NPDC017638 TaxID=3365004 RepID=UPI0037B5D9FD